MILGAALIAGLVALVEPEGSGQNWAKLQQAKVEDLQARLKRIASNSESLEERLRINAIRPRLNISGNPVLAAAVIDGEDYVDIGTWVDFHMYYWCMGIRIAHEKFDSYGPVTQFYLATQIFYQTTVMVRLRPEPGELVAGMSMKEWEGWFAGSGPKEAGGLTSLGLDFILAHEVAHHVLREYTEPAMTADAVAEVEHRADAWALANLMRDKDKAQFACLSAMFALEYIKSMEFLMSSVLGDDALHPPAERRLTLIMSDCKDKGTPQERALLADWEAPTASEISDFDARFAEFDADLAVKLNPSYRRRRVWDTYIRAHRHLRKSERRQGMRRLREAAELGLPHAQFDYGWLLIRERRRIQEGLFWFKRAVDVGMIAAVQTYEAVRLIVPSLPGGAVELCVFDRAEGEFRPIWAECVERWQRDYVTKCLAETPEVDRIDCTRRSQSFESTTFAAEECAGALKPRRIEMMKSVRRSCIDADREAGDKGAP